MASVWTWEMLAAVYLPTDHPDFSVLLWVNVFFPYSYTSAVTVPPGSNKVFVAFAAFSLKVETSKMQR